VTEGDDGTPNGAVERLKALEELPAGQGMLILDQVGEARNRLSYAPAALPRFKPDALHDAVRFLGPGQLWIVAAQTGIGKTTFTLSTIADWVSMGIKVCLVPTELEDWEVRRDLACLTADVDKRIAIENTWHEHADGMEMLERVDEALRLQAEPPWSDHLMVLPYRTVTDEVLLDAGKAAQEFGAKLLVVDHLDHIDYDKRQTFALAGKIARAAKATAEEYGLTVLGMKQIHNAAAMGDPLQRYMAPQLHQLQGGGLTAQNAAVVLGIYRPLVELFGDEGKKRLAAVRAKLLDAREVLMPNTMGVVVLKHRPQGQLEGRRCLLTVRHGRVTQRGET